MWPFKKRLKSSSTSLDINEVILEIIENERKTAKDHLKDSYYTDMMTGHNIGKDEELAVKYAEIALKSAHNLLYDQRQFVNKFIQELMNQQNIFRRVCEDPDGYGIATLNSVEQKTKNKAKELRIDDLIFDEPSNGKEDSIYNVFPETISSYDFDRELQNSMLISKKLLLEKKYLLAFDALQVHIIQLAARLYLLFKDSDNAEIAIYITRLKVAQTLLLESLLQSNVPKIVSNHLWGYVFGCNFIITYMESTKNKYEINQVTGKKLPFTIFALDFDLVESKPDDGLIHINEYSESSDHNMIYQGLVAIHEVLDVEGIDFICGLFLSQNEILDLLDSKAAIIGYFNHYKILNNYEVEDGLTEITSICLKNTGTGNLEVSIVRVGTIGEVNQLITELYEHISHAISFGDHSDGDLDRKLNHLSSLLYQPYDEFLEDCDTIAFFPEGNLFLVPFSALLDLSSKHLILKNNVLLISGFYGLKNTCLSLNQEDKGLIIYNPDFGGDDYYKNNKEYFSQLPYSEKEGDAIITLTNWDSISGKSATYDNFISKIKDKTILHISTHGSFDSDKISLDLSEASINPEKFFNHFSNIEQKGFFTLAGVNDNTLYSIVYSKQLKSLSIKNVKLAYLSLCIAGAGDSVEGDGLFGVSRALKVAGVSCVISNTYPIEDKISSELAVSFYNKIIYGDTFLNALRLSQLEKSKNGLEWFHWAGYNAHL